jgi:hypothetical protein
MQVPAQALLAAAPLGDQVVAVIDSSFSSRRSGSSGGG